MTREELIRQAALRMDEITPENDIKLEVGVDDNNPLFVLIDGMIEDSVIDLFKIAPLTHLPISKVTEDCITLDYADSAKTRQKICILIPEDCIRFVGVRTEQFRRPIVRFYDEDSPEARRQSDPYLIAKESKPIAVYNHAKTRIECFSIPSDAKRDEQLEATYIAKPTSLGPDISDSVPEILIPALEWLIASRVFGARGDAARKATCEENVQRLML